MLIIEVLNNVSLNKGCIARVPTEGTVYGTTSTTPIQLQASIRAYYDCKHANAVSVVGVSSGTDKNIPTGQIVAQYDIL